MFACFCLLHAMLNRQQVLPAVAKLISCQGKEAQDKRLQIWLTSTQGRVFEVAQGGD